MNVKIWESREMAAIGSKKKNKKQKQTPKPVLCAFKMIL